MKVLSYFLFLFIPIIAYTQPPEHVSLNKAKMDSLFSIIENNKKGMGSVSIFKNGKEIYQHAFGFVDVADSIPATLETKYRIGSISKTYTASIIMQLIEENKLRLDTKLGEFYPEIPGSEKITIEQLLRHRSGLYNFTNSEEYPEWMEEPKTRAELIEIFIENGNVFEPDEKTEYSNTNYVLLSFIAEKIANKDFADILKKRITRPLKLKNTYYGTGINPDKNEALSYTKVESWKLASETDMSVPVGAGAVVSSPTDLNRFFYSLFTGKVVSENSLNEMKKRVEGIGIGMFQMPFYDKKAYGHNGGIDGFRSNAAYFPEDSVSLAVTMNGLDMSLNDILIGALSIYYDKEYTLPQFTPAIQLKSEDLDVYPGVYSSPTFPLKITITKKDSILRGQGTGQPSFPLEAFEPHKFRFDQAGLTMEFIPEENIMILRQGGGEFELMKEE